MENKLKVELENNPAKAGKEPCYRCGQLIGDAEYIVNEDGAPRHFSCTLTTPGEWQTGAGDCTTIYGPKTNGHQQVIARCPSQNGKVDYEYGNVSANARLIAAAPDLLSALKEIMDLITSGALVRDTSGDANPSFAMRQLPLVMALKDAETAIAKAEVRS